MVKIIRGRNSEYKIILIGMIHLNGKITTLDKDSLETMKKKSIEVTIHLKSIRYIIILNELTGGTK